MNHPLKSSGEKSCPAEVFLVAIVEIDKEQRIRCQAPGCVQTVFRRVHITLVGQEFQLLGSTCFERLYSHLPIENRSPQYAALNGRELTSEERALIEANTADFVAYLQSQDRSALLGSASRLIPRDLGQVFDAGMAQQRDAAVVPRSTRQALEFMWRKGAVITSEAIMALTDPVERLVLKYHAGGKFGDPWALAQRVLGRHGVTHEATIAVLARYQLIEKLPAYRDVPLD